MSHETDKNTMILMERIEALITEEDFVEKNNGRIWAESEEGKAVPYKFIIPAMAVSS